MALAKGVWAFCSYLFVPQWGRKIKHSPIKYNMQTIVFGAGASVPFFYNPSLSTKFLTEQISDINQWKRIMAKYRQYEADNELVTPDSVRAVIDSILKYIPEANFEQIAEVLDKISSYGVESRPDINMMNLQWRVMHEVAKAPGNLSFLFGPGWRDIPFLLREIIAESILELENNHKSSNHEELINLQRRFIESVANASEKTSVLSFNYDDCVINSLEGLGFEKGFENTNSLYLRQLNPKKLVDAKRVVYFPHGHIKFHFTDNDNVTFWGDSEMANEERWQGVGSSMMGSTITVLPAKYAYNFNTFITTGQTKDDSLNHLPYSAYYQKLACDLLNSNKVYIVGYSFGDDHVNRLLQTFLKINKENKVYVVDYYTSKITLVNEYETESNIINLIHQVLGTTWQLKIDSNNEKQPFDKTQVDTINKLGYGEIFDQVVFYKKGYDAFLHEFEKVID